MADFLGGKIILFFFLFILTFPPVHKPRPPAQGPGGPEVGEKKAGFFFLLFLWGGGAFGFLGVWGFWLQWGGAVKSAFSKNFRAARGFFRPLFVIQTVKSWPRLVICGSRAPSFFPLASLGPGVFPVQPSP